MNKKKSFLTFSSIKNWKGDIVKNIYFLFDIKDLYEYLEETYRLVEDNNKEKLSCVFNETYKGIDGSVSHIYIYGQKEKEQYVDAEFFLYKDKVILVFRNNIIKHKKKN